MGGLPIKNGFLRSLSEMEKLGYFVEVDHNEYRIFHPVSGLHLTMWKDRSDEYLGTSEELTLSLNEVKDEGKPSERELWWAIKKNTKLFQVYGDMIVDIVDHLEDDLFEI